ncbi:hypothetical protein TrVGV298_009698 [Trichoderma virens]|nr:hypothetical protein TrVGV298_009698 [Trichoderma virens]
MAFFQRPFYAPKTSFTPLFRLLKDFDNYSHRRSGLAHWQPKFDVRETDSTYELYGKLPGMSKDDVYVEFTDSQSILIRGKVERAYISGTPPAGALEGTTTSGAIAEGGGEQTEPSSYKATVENTAEDTPAAANPSKTPQSATTKKPADTAKYWLTERSFGEFLRTFDFTTPVNPNSEMLLPEF